MLPITSQIIGHIYLIFIIRTISGPILTVAIILLEMNQNGQNIKKIKFLLYSNALIPINVYYMINDGNYMLN